MVMKMKDSDWEILYELKKNLNMTKVANLLYITQPSLTKRLQYMESEFQVSILNRSGKTLTFTPEGEYLAERAACYMEFQHETNKGLERFKKNYSGLIKIGSSYTYSKYRLSDILMHYRQEHPNVEIKVVNDQSNLLLRKVIEGSVDVGFIRNDYTDSVQKLLIAQNQAYLVTKEPVEPESLRQMSKIDYKTNDYTRQLFDEWWEEQFGTAAPVGMDVGYVDFAWQLIDRGVGFTICFLPAGFKNEYNLCLTPLIKKDGNPVVRNTWFIYPKSKRLPDVQQQFIAYVEKELALPKEKRILKD